MLAGVCRVLVLRGEAGVGKSALLGYLSYRFNGLGHYEEALAAGRKASDERLGLFSYWIDHWALAEVVEAGTRTGNIRLAADAHERLVSVASASGTD